MKIFYTNNYQHDVQYYSIRTIDHMIYITVLRLEIERKPILMRGVCNVTCSVNPDIYLYIMLYKHFFQFLTTKTGVNQKAYIELLESPGDQKNPLHVAAQKVHNILSIPESFNTNISHQIFDYTTTFVNFQHQNTNLKGDIVLKNRF